MSSNRQHSPKVSDKLLKLRDFFMVRRGFTWQIDDSRAPDRDRRGAPAPNTATRKDTTHPI
jgi:hypothetical protein